MPIPLNKLPCTKSRKPSPESASDDETVHIAESMSGPGYSRPKSSLPPEVINSFEKEQRIKNQFLQSEPKIKQNKLRDDEKQGHDLSITSLVKRMEQVNETTAEKSVLNPNTLDSIAGSGPELIAEKVFNKRTSENGGTEYLVMWKGFSVKKWKGLNCKKATWVPMENLDCVALIAAFENDSSSAIKQGK